MTDLSQSSLSLQYVNVLITAVGGNPSEDTVQMAFTRTGNPGSGDWNDASWADQGNLPTTQAIAQCLVGPAGTVTLPVGTYKIWVRLLDSPEVPVLPAGTLAIY